MLSSVASYERIDHHTNELCCKPIGSSITDEAVSENSGNCRSQVSLLIHQLENQIRAQEAAEPEKDAKSLTDLVSEIHSVLGLDHGLGDDPEKLKLVRDAMESYSLETGDWIHHANYSGGGYTRNLVDSGNGKFNLLLLVWRPNSVSPIHDHSGSHCMLKMLKGNLVEEIYREGESGSELSDDSDDKLKLTKSSSVLPNQVAYINDKIGYHRMVNPGQEFAVSLHLYSPPFDVCKVFKKETGDSHTSNCNTYYSK
ncbi:Cysteine dioxygenase [Smittium mucronatum]|uniref:Cysteine dioxygenase n=1 Tax=Smittium mucronatum TaxID=133383 RepID=A0A1R0GWV1_9FUNG|nr:Cysteine dioxygenase [Smittium mucronatum]